MSKTIDWKNLGFQYLPTNSFMKVEYSQGHWHNIERCTGTNISLHVAATCLHYGQACFEGLKAFTMKNGTVATFRPLENAKRLITSAERLCMEPPPEDLFLEVVNSAINDNMEFVPPYGTGACLYIRPLLIGSGPRVGVKPSDEYTFYVLVMPVGPYYKNGFFPVKAYVQKNYDRAAPKGIGRIKAAGNYAAGMSGDKEAKSLGFPISLYLDSATHTYLEEFGTSNVICISSDKRYVTPKSSSILPSITNDSLQVLAQDLGFTVEKRPVAINELAEFVEIGACGTAAVITPIYSITHNDTVYTFGDEKTAGETLTKLFTELQGIQYGEIEDRHQWMAPVV